MFYTEEIDNERWEMFLETDKNVGNWRNMPEYNHKSQWWISDHGRVKVTNNYNDLVHWPRIYMTGGHPAKRYAALSINNAPSKYIHRLVAMYFIPNPDGLRTVNHIDHNPLNNHYTNLEWASHKENHRHGKEMRQSGLNIFSQVHYNLDLIEHNQYNPRASKEELVIGLRLQGMTLQAIADQTGIPLGTVARIVHRKLGYSRRNSSRK